MFSLVRSRFRIRQQKLRDFNVDIELGLSRSNFKDDSAGAEKFENGNTRNTRIQEFPEGNHGCIEFMLNFDYYTGFSPIRVTNDGKVKTSLLAKVANLTINGIGLISVLIALKFRFSALQNGYGSKVLQYLRIGYQISRILLQLKYMQLLWGPWKDIEQLEKARRASSLAPVNQSNSSKAQRRARGFAYGTRLCSILTCSLGVLFGLAVLSHKDNWSMMEILGSYELRLDFAFHPNGAVGNDTSPASNTCWISDETETVLLGGSGMMLNMVDEMLTACPSDFLLLAALSLWNCLQQLMFNEINPEVLNDDERMMEALVHTEVRRHTDIEKISTHTNKLVKLFLPYLAISNTIIAASFILNCLERNWFKVLYLSFKIFKGLVTYGIAYKISERADDYYEWFLERQVHDLLGHDAIDVHLKTEKLKTKPIGIGSGVLYISDRFIASLLGNISHYFFLLVEGFEK